MLEHFELEETTVADYNIWLFYNVIFNMLLLYILLYSYYKFSFGEDSRISVETFRPSFRGFVWKYRIDLNHRGTRQMTHEPSVETDEDIPTQG
jgi:hypothetical protein